MLSDLLQSLLSPHTIEKAIPPRTYFQMKSSNEEKYLD
jgi:hypothetical protein